MKKLFFFAIISLLITITLSSFAQNTNPIPRDTIRLSSGKIMAMADCGSNFFKFLSEQGLETNERCDDCFGLTIRKTKTDYWICASCACRTDNERGPTITKNGELAEFSELEHVKQLILQNRSAMKKFVFKKNTKKGSKGDVIYIM